MLMIGDSLGVGTAPYLKSASGKGTKVNAEVGRTLSEGMSIYRSLGKTPKTVAMGLFTNNAPQGVAELRRAIEQTVRDARERGGNVIWATIVRPPVSGESYQKVNDLIRNMAKKNSDVMGVVDWQKAVAEHPAYVGADNIHGTAEGYKARAQMFAKVEKQLNAGGDTAPSDAGSHGARDAKAGSSRAQRAFDAATAYRPSDSSRGDSSAAPAPPPTGSQDAIDSSQLSAAFPSVFDQLMEMIEQALAQLRKAREKR